MARKKVEKKIENKAEEIVYIDGLRFEPGYKNMLMSEKLSRNKETNELYSLGPGSGLPLKKNERISENSFVEIVRYVELSADKDLLNKLAYIAKRKQDNERKKNDILGLKIKAMNIVNEEYEALLSALEAKYKQQIEEIDGHYEPLINQAEYDIETLNIFNDSILSKYEDQEKEKVKTIK